MMNNIPILYSFRRCPYAMRARMIIACSQIRVEIREVVLKDKPNELLLVSPKATVPVLVVPHETRTETRNESKAKNDDLVLEESLDIMQWVLLQADPDGLMLPFSQEQNLTDIALISENDNEFKQHLDHYKYADRFPAYNEEYYRSQGEVFLKKLDDVLSVKKYLTGESISVVDIAIFPFVRQFSSVDKEWFDQSPYVYLIKWLNELLVSDMFVRVMKKYPQWKTGDVITVFPDTN